MYKLNNDRELIRILRSFKTYYLKKEAFIINLFSQSYQIQINIILEKLPLEIYMIFLINNCNRYLIIDITS